MNRHENISATRRNLAQNLRRYRAEKGISQEVLADLAELHRTYIGSVERGERNVSIDNIDKLSVALGVTVGQLLECEKT